VWGLESLVEYDAARAAGCDFGLPIYVSATWTSAEFKDTTSFLAGGGDAVYQGGRDGNEIPYVPAWKIGAGVGVEFERWGATLDMRYQSTSWGTGFNGDSRAALTGGTPTIRDGKIDALLLFDLSAHYQVSENLKLVGGLLNLFDERGIVSRIPEGPRNNSPRSWFAGMELLF
jgi:Fe(3+) dicitrate transport protein